jgi:membrane protein implicated in regulation of membrane protease activity
MRNIIMAFSAGIALATSALSGEEDLHAGGPWILTLIIFPASALLCLAFVLRDQRRRERADSQREHDSASSSSETGESVSGER